VALVVTFGMFATGGPGAAAADLTVTVMTFNIRYGSANDGPDRWDQRREMVRDAIQRVAADFVGAQEALPDQVAYLSEQLPGYECLARSREANANVGEACPLWYQTGRWRLDPNERGFFWLSETPEVPGSRSWNTACTRMVTWGRFLEKKAGRGIYVYNTHFDHVSEEARRESAKLLARRIADRKHAEPALVTGDFNSGESSGAIEYLTGRADGAPVKLVDTFRAIHPDAKDVGTFHGFRGTRTGPKIDFIFASPGAKTLAAEILHDTRNGRDPSDHFPVTAKVAWPE
jgi:endonuclease/exonuclease/phosphatase family metal-dependent hydrolase